MNLLIKRTITIVKFILSYVCLVAGSSFCSLPGLICWRRLGGGPHHHHSPLSRRHWVGGGSGGGLSCRNRSKHGHVCRNAAVSLGRRHRSKGDSSGGGLSRCSVSRHGHVLRPANVRALRFDLCGT